MTTYNFTALLDEKVTRLFANLILTHEQEVKLALSIIPSLKTDRFFAKLKFYQAEGGAMRLHLPYDAGLALADWANAKLETISCGQKPETNDQSDICRALHIVTLNLKHGGEWLVFSSSNNLQSSKI